MKRKKIRRVTAIALATAMLASMTACGGDNNSNQTTPAATTTSNSAGTTASNDNTTTTQAENKEKAEITFMTIDFEGNPLSEGASIPYAEECLALMEDYTNTKVDFTWVANDVLEEKVTLALANPKEMPMIMAVGEITGAIISAANAGAFIDLNNYMFDSAKYPNLSQANPNVCQSLTVGGKLIGVYRARVVGRYGIAYRADWAEKLGLDEPKTIDDMYEMMSQFTYGDPDGNEQDDTYGLALCQYTGPFDIMQTWFGVGNKWAEQDGKLIPVHMQPEYKEALDWFKKMYDDGLVYKDWAVRGSDQWEDNVKNGECGIFIDTTDGGRRIWDYFVNNSIPSVIEGQETASMNLIGTINDKTLATTGYNGMFVLSASTCNTDEKIEDCLHFLDKMCDDEMLVLSAWGLQDVHWKLDENGYLVDIKDPTDANAAKAYQALNQTVAYIPNIAQTSPIKEENERTQRMNQVREENIPYAVFNPANAYLINSSTYSLSGATLDQILSQARTQYICGQIDEAGLQQAWDTWLSTGGQALIDEVNEQYKSN